MFDHDPEIKRECVWSGAKLRPSAVLVDRRGPFVRSRADGDWLMLTQSDCHAITLSKSFGDTTVEGSLEPSRWEWPAR